MKLLILDGPRDPQTAECFSYHGTYRAHPTYCETLPEGHEINRLFFWFLQTGSELGVVEDAKKALRFAELWNTQLTGQGRFEVVEVTDGDSGSESGGTFMGFDLSAGYNNSLLRCGLKSGARPAGISQSVWDDWELIRRSYIPQLNSAGLFGTVVTASDCLQSMIALQDTSANFFEGGDLRRFQVTGLYLVSGNTGMDGTLPVNGR